MKFKAINDFSFEKFHIDRTTLVKPSFTITFSPQEMDFFKKNIKTRWESVNVPSDSLELYLTYSVSMRGLSTFESLTEEGKKLLTNILTEFKIPQLSSTEKKLFNEHFCNKYKEDMKDENFQQAIWLTLDRPVRIASYIDTDFNKLPTQYKIMRLRLAGV